MARASALVDVNSWLGTWPFQYFRDDTAAKLEARMEALGIGRCLVGSPEAAFNPDCAAANRILSKRLSGRSHLHAVPALNPILQDWPDILARARDEGRVAVRLFPTYHSYELGSTASLSAIERIAADPALALFLQMRMEDERTHHPRCRIPGLDVAQIEEVARRFPELRVVALCAYFHEAVELAKRTTSVSMDISHVETFRTLRTLFVEVPYQRVLFGTHAPFLYPRAAVEKLGAPYVSEEERKAVGWANALGITRR